MTEPYTGQIITTPYTFTVKGFAGCFGQLMSISENQALFSLLGDNFGGDGRSTFGIPDLRGRTPVGVELGPGLSPIGLGQKGGSQIAILEVKHMPSHTHTAEVTPAGGTGDLVGSLSVEANPGTTGTPTGDTFLAQSGSGINVIEKFKQKASASNLVDIPGVKVKAAAALPTVTNQNNGGSQPFSIMNPVLGLRFQIALGGVYPPRD